MILGAGPLGTPLTHQRAARGEEVRLSSILVNRVYDMGVIP